MQNRIRINWLWLFWFIEPRLRSCALLCRINMFWKREYLDHKMHWEWWILSVKWYLSLKMIWIWRYFALVILQRHWIKLYISNGSKINLKLNFNWWFEDEIGRSLPNLTVPIPQLTLLFLTILETIIVRNLVGLAIDTIVCFHTVIVQSFCALTG